MKKILTLILDGFSMREDIYGNAVKNAGMSHFSDIWNNYPHALLSTTEGVIDLSKRQSIDSTFGHKILGAGKPIKPLINDINDHFKKDDLNTNKKYQELINYLQLTNKNLHIPILLSDGGISSHIDILKLFLIELQKSNIKNNIYLDIISDGRDSLQRSILIYLKELDLKNIPLNITISSLCGRFYSLDDTGNYSRTKVYYDLLFDIDGVEVTNLENIIKLCYEKQLNDDYLPPIKTKDYKPMQNGDVIMLLNISKFNQKQLLEALSPNFNKFARKKTTPVVYSLYEIDNKLNENYFFKEETIENSICEYMGELGVNQAKVFESIKKNSMTYYLDGCKDINIDNCDLYMVDTPKMEKNDEHPELGALGITKALIKCMEKDYDFIIGNFANPDVLGHTGNYQAIINGLQVIDVCLGKIVEIAEENFYKVIIIGSHGNVDTIIDQNNNIITKDTRSYVPFVVMDNKLKLKNGNLSDVAPTILKYLDISIPKEMKKMKTLIEEN